MASIKAGGACQEFHLRWLHAALEASSIMCADSVSTTIKANSQPVRLAGG
jgi:hypothetical protein